MFREHLQEFLLSQCQRGQFPEELQVMLAAAFFAKVVEVGIEGKHALAKTRLKKRASSYPTPQLVSTELRFREFQGYAADQKVYDAMLEEFTKALDVTYIVSAFGMHEHEHLQRGLLVHDRLTTSVVAAALYHVDPTTNFRSHTQEIRDMKRKRRQVRASRQLAATTLALKRHDGKGYAHAVWKAAVEHLRGRCKTHTFYSGQCRHASAWEISSIQDRARLPQDTFSWPISDVPVWDLERFHDPKLHRGK